MTGFDEHHLGATVADLERAAGHRPAWLAGLIARHGEPLIVRRVYDMSSDVEYAWREPGFTVRVGQSWDCHYVSATRHGGRFVNLGGLEQPPTDADISGVIALAGLDDVMLAALLSSRAETEIDDVIVRQIIWAVRDPDSIVPRNGHKESDDEWTTRAVRCVLAGRLLPPDAGTAS